MALCHWVSKVVLPPFSYVPSILETLLELGCDPNEVPKDDRPERPTIGSGILILVDVDVHLQTQRQNNEAHKWEQSQEVGAKLIEILFNYGLRLPSRGRYARSDFRHTFSGLLRDDKIHDLLAVYDARNKMAYTHRKSANSWSRWIPIMSRK
jgi:hypothetical protein